MFAANLFHQPFFLAYFHAQEEGLQELKLLWHVLMKFGIEHKLTFWNNSLTFKVSEFMLAFDHQRNRFRQIGL